MHPKSKLEALTAKGLRQDHIAEMVATNQATISRILNGDTKKPNWQVVEFIGQLYQHVIIDNESTETFSRRHLETA